MTLAVFGAMERRGAAGVAKADARGIFLMRRSIFVLAATTLGALIVAGCDDYQSGSRDEYADAPPMEEQAPAAEDSAEPVVAPEVTDPAPTSAPAPTPPEERTSEQSVQPESETLFY